MRISDSSKLKHENSFFKNPYYSEDLKKEYDNPTASCVYRDLRHKTEASTFPFFYLIKKLVPLLILPAITRSRPDSFGSELSREQEFKYKRLTIRTGDLSIDATLMGTADTFQHSKWILPSLGNMELYEDKLLSTNFQSLLKKSNSNAILFNYPGVGASTGIPSSKAAVKAYQAVLRFLEDEKNGVGAKQIIGYGFSIGGGIQGEALKDYPLEEGLEKGIQYVFVKDRSFSTLEKVARYFVGFLGKILFLFGWSLDSIKSSKKLAKLRIPEIVIQATDIHNVPVSDGVISAYASLKKDIYELGLPYKTYINLRTHQPELLHNTQLDPTLTTECIQSSLNIYT